MTMHPDIRGELGKQRQAELIAQAQRERLAQLAERDQLSALRRLIGTIHPRLRRLRDSGASKTLPKAQPLVEPD
jgi:hypothetical protein